MKKALALILSAIFALTSLSLVLLPVTAEETDTLSEKVIYVKADGDEAHDGLTPEKPVASFTHAMELLGLEGGTITVIGEVPMDKDGIKWFAKESEGMKRIVITGYDDTSTLVWTRSFNPDGPLTVEYINIRLEASYSYLNAKGHSLVIGYGVYVTKLDDVKTYLCVRGGGDTNTNIEGDTNVTVYSGKYSQICGGSRNGYIAGDTHITVYGGEISGVYGGNNNGSEEEAKGRNVRGNSYITIYGGSISACMGTDGSKNSIVEGKMYLDVSSYPYAREDWYANFTDVTKYDENATAEEKKAEEIVADGSFINGYTDGTFKPQNQITRAEAISIIARLIAKAEDIKGKNECTFTDVEKTAWFYDSVAYMESKLFLTFLTERGNKLLPTQPITRAEVCGLIYGIGFFPSFTIKDFPDLTARSNKTQIYALASAGIITGYADGTFKPEGTITRAEFVTIVDRFLGRNTVEANADSANKFSDISEHWAKNYIVAASSEKQVDGKDIWTKSNEIKAFTLSDNAKTPADYIKELNEASKALTSTAITDGIDALAQKRIDEIEGTKTSVEIKGTTYYVSEKGDDAADGKTPTTAWKTLTKVNTASFTAGDGVLFERGCTWRGNLTARSGVTYSAYGEGAKPNLYGWAKNSADPALWVETDTKNVWKYTDTVSQDVGNIIFNHGEKHSRKIILQYNDDKTTKDVRTKQPYAGINDIIDNLSFYHDNATGYVYLRCNEGNPGEVFEDIEMAKKQHVISNTANDVTIDNLCVKYTGSHGLGFGSCKGLTVQNCEFAWIGGSIQTEVGAYGRNWATPYGNAIEIYGEAVDFTVENNYIHDVYDAGATHQISGKEVSNKNIKYINNVIERCVYAIEIFVGEVEGKTVSQDGVLIENNILRRGGGFGHEQRPDTGVTALIRNGATTKDTKNYIVRNNIFDRSKTRLITAAADGGSKAEYFDNIYVQINSVQFCTRNGVGYGSDASVKNSLVNLGGETNPTIILVDGKFDY